jgi:hypothetical protein
VQIPTTRRSRVDYHFAALNMLGGVIPNRTVAALRSDPEVEFVEGVPPFPLCSI